MLKRTFAAIAALLAIIAIAACSSTGTQQLPSTNAAPLATITARPLDDCGPAPQLNGRAQPDFTTCSTPTPSPVCDPDVPGSCTPTCPEVARSNVMAKTEGSCTPTGGGGGGGTTNAQKIYNAAVAFRGQSTKGLAPGRGEECVGAVQHVLQMGGLSVVDNGTVGANAFWNNLAADGYVQVPANQAPQPGDIVVLTDNSADPATHVGIYMGNGYMLSNSSSAQTFSWYDTPSNENANAAYWDTEGGVAPGTYTPGTIYYFHHP